MKAQLKKLDGFQRTVDEFRVRTRTGGLISIIGVSLIIILSLREWLVFLKREAMEEVVVDVSVDERLSIHLDITFPNLECDTVGLSAMDANGDIQKGSLHSIFKLPLDHRGIANGNAAYQDAEVDTQASFSDMLKASEVEDTPNDANLNRKLAPINKKCGWCYGPEDEGKCCNTCADVKRAFADRKWDWIEGKYGSGQYWQCNGGVMPTEEKLGCRMFGQVSVNKVRGSFHIAPAVQAVEFMLRMFSSHPRELNMSFVLHELWFGDVHPQEAMKMVKNIDSRNDLVAQSPLKDISRIFAVPSFVQYHVKIIPTSCELRSEESTMFYQYSTNEHVAPLTRAAVPTFHVFYDSPPLVLKFKEHPKPLGHFLTNICALVGGTVSLMAFVDNLLYRNNIKLV